MRWMPIALVGTILTIGGPVLAAAQSSQTKSDTYAHGVISTRSDPPEPNPDSAERLSML